MKRIILFITFIILIFCLTACDGHYGGYDLEAYPSSKDLNITKIVVVYILKMMFVVLI